MTHLDELETLETWLISSCKIIQMHRNKSHERYSQAQSLRFLFSMQAAAHWEVQTYQNWQTCDKLEPLILEVKSKSFC